MVLKSAQQSGALVQSLFPGAVRDRLYEEQEAKRNKQKMDDSNTWEGNAGQPQASASAIAQLYPATTIFFADLA